MNKVFFVTCILLWQACTTVNPRLPILGDPIIHSTDTIYPTVASFKLWDQDSLPVTNQTFEGGIYLADFIFLSCPTICPKMTSVMQEVYQQTVTNPKVKFLTHSIDPQNDSITRLKSYATQLGATTSKWHFVTGPQDTILSLAEKSYLSTAYRDSTSPGGFTHSGGILLVDSRRHIRGVYDGTDTKSKDMILSDIKKLLEETN